MKIMNVSSCGVKNQTFGYMGSPVMKKVVAETTKEFQPKELNKYYGAMLNFIKARFNFENLLESYSLKLQSLGFEVYHSAVKFLQTLDTSSHSIIPTNTKYDENEKLDIHAEICDATKQNGYKMNIHCGDHDICLKQFENEKQAENYIKEHLSSAEKIDEFKTVIDSKIESFIREQLDKIYESANNNVAKNI